MFWLLSQKRTTDFLFSHAPRHGKTEPMTYTWKVVEITHYFEIW
jgi:hypothetical protein